ncbi:hypothetical protein ACFFMN_26750 [Planobispora siamensis]|uniref:Uncharacterized protein n=1 Tax=Planobispora siamensis TaxID=936338 RepID=A0A8J3SDB8_9ACTN|nr:hypothetical protein [Planobispora siamensis]GIH90732.1 hypothetical protein Psi01_13620 [Planobispora siamensis]
MTHPDQPATRDQRSFWEKPPIWLRALGIPIALLATLQMSDERGPLMGVLAGVVYGSLAIGLLAWDRFMVWGREHPLLDTLSFGPVMFLVLATLTPLSPMVCAAAAAGATVLFVVLKHLQRRRAPQS